MFHAGIARRKRMQVLSTAALKSNKAIMRLRLAPFHPANTVKHRLLNFMR